MTTFIGRFYRIHDFKANPDFFSHRSAHWDMDDRGNMIKVVELDGVCASPSLRDLLDYFNVKNLKGLARACNGKSLVVFEGKDVDSVGDGDVVVPIRIIHRIDFPEVVVEEKSTAELIREIIEKRKEGKRRGEDEQR